MTDDAGRGGRQYPLDGVQPGSGGGDRWSPTGSWAPGGPAPATLPLAGGWHAPGPVRKGRKALWLSVAAAAAVLIVTAIVVVVGTSGGGSQSGAGSPADAVKGYLQALARGDAHTALSYSSDQPASTQFVGDDVLKKQIAHWPITNIRILQNDAHADAYGIAAIHVVATFGTTTSDAVVNLKRTGGRWLLNTSTVRVQPSKAIGDYPMGKTLTFFGKPVGESTVDVFPGWVDVASTNRYLAVTAKPLLLDQLTPDLPWFQATFTLNDAGTKATTDALAGAFASCLQSHALKPPSPCSRIGLNPNEFVEGTANWGTPDFSKIQQSLDPQTQAVTFDGMVFSQVTVQRRSGETSQLNVQHPIHGVADINKAPPDVTFAY